MLKSLIRIFKIVLFIFILPPVLFAVVMSPPVFGFYNALGLEKIAAETMQQSKISVTEVDCTMNDEGRSRAGICLLTITPAEFEKAKAAWGLMPANAKSNIESFLSHEGCLSHALFGTIAEKSKINYGGGDLRDWFTYKPLPSVQVLIPAGHSTGLFSYYQNTIYYNPDANKICVTTGFRYG